jgi:very-short-patch-repair endonuclease
MQAEGFAPKGERLFIKNLESVQGDERDVIFISIGYGRDAYNQMSQGFGPLSNDGGERRLNVLASRARLQCVVFSSISAADIAADSKPLGTRMLREFLHYAETKNFGAGEVNDGDYDSPFEESVAILIREAGFKVQSQVGVSSFRVDLGVLDPHKPGKFVLGVECDGATYHSGRSARDRDRLRQEILEGLGWNLHRIWSTDWFKNPEREAKKLFAANRASVFGSVCRKWFWGFWCKSERAAQKGSAHCSKCRNATSGLDREVGYFGFS